MGCGKSSVGRELSELLCCPFMDLDDAIVESAGRSIPEIFATEGEPAFRQMELEALKEMVPKYSRGPLPQKADSSKDTFILSLGGGTVMTPECEAMVRENTLCIYLRTSVETIVSRLSSETEGRPVLNAIPSGTEESVPQVEALRARIESLMARRASTYERTAHIIIDTDSHTIDSLAEELSKIIQK